MKPLSDEDLRGGDEADRANAQAEQNLAIAIRRAHTGLLRATGYCLWCDEVLPRGMRFCEPDVLDPIEWACAREYDKNEKTLSRIKPGTGPEKLLEDPIEVLRQMEDDGVR